MARLVFSGVFDRHPGLKIVTHHLGGGMIPFFDGRIGAGMQVLGSRTSDEDYSNVLKSLQRPHLDYFRDFYADTALFGAGNGLTCGLDFFGADHVVFSTDAPLGPIGKTIAAIDALDLERNAREKIMAGNAAKLMKLRLAQ
jgi:aminocarboxymuconate-semialdehyde decarboxylase